MYVEYFISKNKNLREWQTEMFYKKNIGYSYMTLMIYFIGTRFSKNTGTVCPLVGSETRQPTCGASGQQNRLFGMLEQKPTRRIVNLSVSW